MTKEQVREAWDNQAKSAIEQFKIVEDKWTQDLCGAITATAFLKLQKNGATKVDLDALCAYGSNSSARKQGLFSAKTAKSTALASEYAKMA